MEESIKLTTPLACLGFSVRLVSACSQCGIYTFKGAMEANIKELSELRSFGHKTLNELIRFQQDNKCTYEELMVNAPINPIDWEQRRYEITKEVLPLVYYDDTESCEIARDAVKLADAVIKELKKGEQL